MRWCAAHGKQRRGAQREERGAEQGESAAGGAGETWTPATPARQSALGYRGADGVSQQGVGEEGSGRDVGVGLARV